MKQPLVGRKAIITHSTGTFKGEIVKETKHMVWLRSDKIRKFIKNTITLTIDNITVHGSDIDVRPYDRIKKK